MDVKKQFASLDSGNYMMRALAQYLHGQDTTAVLPLSPSRMRSLIIPMLEGLLHLPPRWRSELARWAGVREALPPERLDEVSAVDIAALMADRYPKRQYPAIAIGSANGAVLHLCAALHIPWLPQTFLMLARRNVPKDELVEDFEFGRRYGPRFLQANPHAALYQMHDPSNDRLMAQKMGYFRVKHLELPPAYENFIVEHLTPGGTLIVIDCHDTWPQTRISDRHFYQVGGIGGMTIEEYLSGGERVRRLLDRYNSPREKFIVPPPTTETIEAEWGLDTRLLAGIEGLAEEHRYRVKRFAFGYPEDASFVIADLYRWWYEQLGWQTDQLSIESYTNVELQWALKTGSVPFWLIFNGQNSLESAKAYASDESFRRVYYTVFSNNVDAVGIPSIDHWREVLSQPGRELELIGVHEERFPIDFSTPFKYSFDFQDKVPAPYPLPEPLTLDAFESFMAQSASDRATWT